MIDLQYNDCRPKLSRGLTLLELLITVAIAAILLTTVGPNIQSILVSNKITGSVNNLSSVMRFARHTAVNEQAVTTICPTSDYSNCANDWTLPKMVFIDTNGNGNREDEEELAATADALSPTLRANGINGTFTFAADGSALGQRTITFCHSNNEASYARALLITAFGRISISQDGNNDGVAEALDGTPLSCAV